MICVNDKVWKLIGNNYDVTGKPEKETSWFWSWLWEVVLLVNNSYLH